MPGFNRTGPDGAGAMTGRQRGMCPRTDDQAFGPGPGDGSGRGRGLGMRRGMGQGQVQGQRQGRGAGQDRRDIGSAKSQINTIDDQALELRTLKKQYQTAQDTLRSIEAKIADLESGK